MRFYFRCVLICETSRREIDQLGAFPDCPLTNLQAGLSADSFSRGSKC